MPDFYREEESHIASSADVYKVKPNILTSRIPSLSGCVDLDKIAFSQDVFIGTGGFLPEEIKESKEVFVRDMVRALIDSGHVAFTISAPYQGVIQETTRLDNPSIYEKIAGKIRITAQLTVAKPSI